MSAGYLSYFVEQIMESLNTLLRDHNYLCVKSVDRVSLVLASLKQFRTEWLATLRKSISAIGVSSDS